MDWQEREEQKRVIAEGIEEGVWRVVWRWVLFPILVLSVLSLIFLLLLIITQLPWERINLVPGVLMLSLFLIIPIVGIIGEWRHQKSKGVTAAAIQLFVNVPIMMFALVASLRLYQNMKWNGWLCFFIGIFLCGGLLAPIFCLMNWIDAKLGTDIVKQMGTMYKNKKEVGRT